MYRKELQDILRCGVYTQTMVDDAMELVEDHGACFDSCRKSRLCHGDLWVTNLLVERNGDVKGVIDFDRACWGDIEWDLAIAEYCGITRPAFWEGYGNRFANAGGQAAIRRLFYLLYEHQKYIFIRQARSGQSSSAQRYLHDCRAMFDQLAAGNYS